MTEAQPRHYAVRRVNPFEGVLQVFENRDARAYSPNGRVWQIQALAERPDNTWRHLGPGAPVKQFFNFGLWDAEDGLRKIPANPLMDIGGMVAAAEALTGLLSDLLHALPFPLIDDYECWATDQAGEPVALLATTEDPATLQNLRVDHWHATRPADHSFVAPSLDAAGVPRDGDFGTRQHAEHLERQVRGVVRQKTWFQRLPDGRAHRMSPLSEPAAPATLAFPPLGLKTDWQKTGESALARDYIEWLAPCLLMLPSLDDAQRRDLELAACRRAVELDAAYPLIPRIIDRNAIEAARVEASLRRASA